MPNGAGRERRAIPVARRVVCASDRPMRGPPTACHTQPNPKKRVLASFLQRNGDRPPGHPSHSGLSPTTRSLCPATLAQIWPKDIFQAVELVRMESCPAQAVLPLVGLVGDKITRDRYSRDSCSSRNPEGVSRSGLARDSSGCNGSAWPHAIRPLPGWP